MFGRHSQELCDFVGSCMQMDPTQRPSATELLSHPFIQRSIRLGFIDPPNPPSLVFSQQSVPNVSREEARDIMVKLLAW